MLETIELTESHWQSAHAVAIELVKNDTDPNELSKAISYLSAYGERENAGAKFFSYLTTLAKNGDRIGHSKKTIDYYKNIDATCQKHLKDYQNNVPVLLLILGWVVRLMRYYKDAVPMAELNAVETAPIQSEDRAKIAEFSAAQKFTIGQHLEATITGINGNKVSYEMLGVIKKTQKEPKLFNKLKPGQKVQVEIVELTEDGIIDKVKIIS
jgi:hypothetical protein